MAGGTVQRRAAGLSSVSSWGSEPILLLAWAMEKWLEENIDRKTACKLSEIEGVWISG